MLISFFPIVVTVSCITEQYKTYVILFAETTNSYSPELNTTDIIVTTANLTK